MDKPASFASAPSGGPRRQPARVLAAWVGQLIEDARGAQLPRFGELAQQLQSQAFVWDNAFLASAVSAMLQAARQLDCESLDRRGLLARITGEAGRIAARFREACSAVMCASAKVRQHNDNLARDLRTHTAGARRILIELRMECLHLDREVEQGAGWLDQLAQDVGQAKSPDGTVDDPRLAAIAARLPEFTRGLKELEGASEAARDICLAGENVLARRAALLEMIAIDLKGFDSVWARRAGNVAAILRNPLAPVPGLQAVRQAHDELLARLTRTEQANVELQVEEQSMARRLQEFRRQLQQLR